MRRIEARHLPLRPFLLICLLFVLAGSLPARAEGSQTLVTSDMIVMETTGYIYTGEPIYPEFSVVYNGQTLQEGIDYTYNYKSGRTGETEPISACRHNVVIKGIGDYWGEAYKGYEISPITLLSEDMSMYPSTYVYNGEHQYPESIRWKGIELTEGKDYYSSYGPRYAGTKTYSISGKGNYTGRVLIPCEVLPLDLNSAEAEIVYSGGKGWQIYSGTPREPIPSYVEADPGNGRVRLKEGTDYELSWENNVEVGTGFMHVNGIGNYSGRITDTFEIKKADISRFKYTYVPLSPDDPNLQFTYIQFTYNGSAWEPKWEIKQSDTSAPLVEGRDYVITYENNINAGSGTNGPKATITGIGGYTGEKTFTFVIKSKYFNNVTISEIPDQIYTRQELTPRPDSVISDGVVLEYGKDWFITNYQNNIKRGTASADVRGKGNYSGEVTVRFKILPKDISEIEGTLGKTEYTYTGSECKPYIKSWNWPPLTTKLTSGTDYTLSYENNIEVGTGTVYAKGIGNYTGTKSWTFEILPRNISSATVETIMARDYTGREVRPEPVVKWSSKELVKDEDYTLSYSGELINPNSGKGLVTIKGINHYTGEKTVTFSILKVKMTPEIVRLDGVKPVQTTDPYGRTVWGSPREYTYTGSAIKPKVTVTWEGRQLVEGRDFYLVYDRPVDVQRRGGAYNSWVDINARGDYASFFSGMKVYYKIVPADLATAEIIEVEDQIYTGEALTPDPNIVFNGKKLYRNSQYECTYYDNVEVGKAIVEIKSREYSYNFKGSVVKTFQILPPETVLVNSVSLDRYSVKLKAGETLTLKAVVSPDDATDKAVTWTSGDSAIAAVDSSGKITGKKAGKTSITVKTKNGGKTAVCEVEVLEDARPEPVKIKGIRLDKTEAKTVSGKWFSLTATVLPEGTAAKLKWSVSDKKVLYVSQKGKVKGCAPGKATVTVKTADGKYKAVCEVTVFRKVNVALKDGAVYTFASNLNRSFFMEIPKGTKKAGVKPALGKMSKKALQQFRVKVVKMEGKVAWIALINRASGLALTQKDKNTLVQRKFTGDSSQIFRTFKYGDDSIQFVNRKSSKAVSVPGSKASAGALTGFSKLGSANAQRWYPTIVG